MCFIGYLAAHVSLIEDKPWYTYLQFQLREYDALKLCFVAAYLIRLIFDCKIFLVSLYFLAILFFSYFQYLLPSYVLPTAFWIFVSFVCRGLFGLSRFMTSVGARSLREILSGSTWLMSVELNAILQSYQILQFYKVAIEQLS